VGWTEGATAWQDIAAAAVTSSGVLTVSLTVPAAATVHADAVRFEQLCAACTWYADVDGDGFGDAGVTKMACTGGDGWVASDNDCDDSLSSVHPDALDTPDDGVDQDCDGSDAVGASDSGETGAGDSPDSRESRPAAPDERSGCGCTSASGREPVAAIFGLMSLAALRRRKRAKSLER
jgi:MYXO-CTERM domain-containing protein